MNFVHDQRLVRTPGPVSLWRTRLKYSGQNSLDPKGRFDFARLFAPASLEGVGPAARSRNKHSKQNQTVKPRQNYEADSGIYLALDEQLVATDGNHIKSSCSLEHALHSRVADLMDDIERSLIKRLSEMTIVDVCAPV